MSHRDFNTCFVIKNIVPNGTKQKIIYNFYATDILFLAEQEMGKFTIKMIKDNSRIFRRNIILVEKRGEEREIVPSGTI